MQYYCQLFLFRRTDPPEIISDVMTERLSRTRFVLMGKKKDVRLLEGMILENSLRSFQ